MQKDTKDKRDLPPMPRPARVGENKYKPIYCRKLWEYFMTYDGKGIPQMSEFARTIPVTVKTLRNWRNIYEEFALVYEACMDYQAELLTNGGLTGAMNPRMVQFELSANHKRREYTRIAAEEKQGDVEMTEADRRLMQMVEDRLKVGYTEMRPEGTDMLNEGAIPAEEETDGT